MEMETDLWFFYRQMLRSRRFEEAVRSLWEEGKISGEMHLGMGEEAIAVGVVSHLSDGDALALDHRGTPALVVRGVDLVSLLKEFLGRRDGLCSGMGGHMHLFSRNHLAASSGIVGASGPAAAGFALAAQSLGRKKVAVAFFGEGAMNQGMLLESFNLAAAWKLPVIFVCKDNAWAITTRSCSVTGGSLLLRARGFGVPASEVNGLDVEAVWETAGRAVDRARHGRGPSFLLVRCARLEGHFLGDPLVRVARRPVEEMRKLAPPLMRSATKAGGARKAGRFASLGQVSSLIGRITAGQHLRKTDPLRKARRKLKKNLERLLALEEDVAQEIREAVDAARS